MGIKICGCNNDESGKNEEKDVFNNIYNIILFLVQ